MLLRVPIRGWFYFLVGGGGGLGKELAISFAKCGARIVLWDMDKGILTLVILEYS